MNRKMSLFLGLIGAAALFIGGASNAHAACPSSSASPGPGACNTVGCGGDVDECGTGNPVVGGCDPSPGVCTSNMTIQITTANCSGAGGNCNTCSVSPTTTTLNGSATITAATGCGTRNIIICQKWVDCSGVVLCSSCSTVALGSGATTGPTLTCNQIGPGTYQYVVDAVDVAANCHTCGSGCNISGACVNCGPITEYSCCVTVT